MEIRFFTFQFSTVLPKYFHTMEKVTFSSAFSVSYCFLFIFLCRYLTNSHNSATFVIVCLLQLLGILVPLILVRITPSAAQDTGEECLSAPVQLGLWEEDVKVGVLDTITPFHLVAYYFSLFWTWLEFYFVQLGSARLGSARLASRANA